MTEIKVETLEFTGISGRFPAKLMTPAMPSLMRLAVVLPGASYSIRQPLLHYTVQVLLTQGYQVLAFDKLYSEDPNWLSLKTEDEALKVVESDSKMIFEEIRSRFPQGIYTLCGRSLGTYAIACALEQDLVQPAQIIWQCPALREKWSAMQSIGGFAIIGTADPKFKEAEPFLPAESLIVEDADHAMELQDPVASIDVLASVILRTNEWLSTHGDSDLDISQLDRNLKLDPEQRLREHQSALNLTMNLMSAGEKLREQSQ